MRVNLEESVKRHLPRLAKELGCHRHQALGALASFYNATQDAEIIDAPLERLVTVCVLEFDDDSEVEKLVAAMVKVQLVTLLPDGQIHIRGNTEHVNRLKQLRADASRGGKAKAAKNGNHFVASRQAVGCLKDASTLPQPCPPLLLSSLAPLQEQTTNTKNIAAEVTKTRRARLPVAKPPGGLTVPFRDAWQAAYQKRFKQPAAWGKRENGQVMQLLGSYSSADLVALIPYFFAWQRPEVIRGGYSFGKGPACFVLKLDELRADIADRARRQVAAQVEERERVQDSFAKDDDALARVEAIMAKEREDERRLAEAAGRSLDKPAPDKPRALGEGDQETRSGAQPAHERRCHDAILPLASATRQREGDLAGVGGKLR